MVAIISRFAEPLKANSKNVCHSPVLCSLQNSNNDMPNNMHIPIHLAAESGLDDIVKLLIDNGADVNKTQSTGWTPLDIASLNG